MITPQFLSILIFVMVGSFAIGYLLGKFWPDRRG
jgi:hypothetical protein